AQYYPLGDSPSQVEAAYGAALFIKKDLFEKIGGFDEKYFLYYEDIDLCNRLSKIGKNIYYYPLILIEHAVGGSKSDAKRGDINYQSALKYHGLFQTVLLQIIFRL